MTKLENIATIQSAYSFRTAISSYPPGKVKVIQARDVVNFVDSQLLSIDFPDSSYYLQPGQVLVSCRGSFRALFWGKTGQYITAASVLTLTPDSKKIMPEYLVAVINSKLGQAKLNALATGGSIASLAKKQLGELEITLPAKTRQQEIATKINNLLKYQQLAVRKAMLVGDVVGEVIDGLVKN